MIDLTQLKPHAMVCIRENARRGWDFEVQRFGRIQSVEVEASGAVLVNVVDCIGIERSFLINDIEYIIDHKDLADAFEKVENAFGRLNFMYTRGSYKSKEKAK